MIIPSVPFYGVDSRQIDWKWVEEGYGVEANVFDGDDLTPDGFKKLENNIKSILRTGNSNVTLHYPTEQADYLREKQAYEKLLKLIDLSLECDAKVLVVHSNHFISSKNFDHAGLDTIRNAYIDLFWGLSERLNGSNLRICVENLPWIGNESFDADPIFVFPKHFDALGSIPNFEVTFDLCHWGQTFLLWNTMANLVSDIEPIEFNEFLIKCQAIGHLHVSNFKGLSFPNSNAVCVEGELPQSGDVNSRLLAETLNVFHGLDKEYFSVFEVTEEDYTSRRNSWESLRWLERSLAND